ncbi:MULTISPECIES: ABC transporter ATP-binding protein [Streptomyces]|uniref:ABC transporter ATP-binding protein n=1 Tax=Streptomyces lonegramiae TaxID=3075524 RepID=A0ABU2XX49_9ACTN|nr:ABC transporter ATP-binding protein [Streptomyces sp. DSM 41529]MDT0550052.1 ABC transporter ATP-binding protein [Streptomyces sp. DSM 41529]
MRRFPDPEPGIPDHRSPISYLLWLARDLRNSILLGILWGILCVLAQAFVPAAIGAAIDDGIVDRDRRALLLWGGAVLLLGVVQAVTGILRDRATLTTRLGASYRTMQLITRQTAGLGATLPKRMAKGEIVNAGVADIDRIGEALAGTARGSGAVVAIAAIAAIMLDASWRLGAVVLAGVPLMVWAVALLIRPLHRRQERLREHQAELTGRAVDIVSGLRVLRGIGGEEVFAGRYRADSQRLRGAGVALARVDALFGAVKVLLPSLLTCAVVWLGARSVESGRIGAGQFVAFYGYAVYLVDPLRRLTDAVGQITRGHVAARGVTRFLALAPELASGTDRPRSRTGPLADPDSGLTVAPGRFTAVACASPADAATLADRLGRYTDSAVTWQDTPLADLPLAEVRRRILVATNDDVLFAGPLSAELDPAGPRPGSRELLERALDTASARDIVEALPDGPDTVIAASGRDLSGGQQQRLRLVRALMADPEVLVLVEPTSAVDAHTEARVARGLGAHRAGRTTVVFTTSPILLDRADHVVYVENAKAVAHGTHGELLGDPRYRAVVAREEETI